jgi:NAD(P)H-dependent flavin oxidoreductase YrpB (nitropropane dioxygenase family)
MQTPICKKLGMENPIFAFTHCRDVVLAVSKAGGIGVLGAVGFSVEKLKEELDWIDARIGDKPYGVDIVIPQKYEGMGEMDPKKLEESLEAMIPQKHRDFAAKLYADHGVPEWPDKNDKVGLLGWNEGMATMLVEEAIKRPQCRLIANALGTPPDHIIKRVQESGRLIGALCGKVKQAKQHKKAGLDFIIAQGGEGGGHAGDVGSIVLWPSIIDAVGDTPVLAAGGIGSGRAILAAMAMGAQGVWTGSIWLAVEEADAEPAQKQSYFNATEEDTVRSRSWTGKPCRMLKNDWTEAWGKGDPDPLPMPLQGLVTVDAIRRSHKYAAVGECQKVAFNPVGQVVGQIKQVESCRNLINRLLTEYVEAAERVNSLMSEA